LHFLKGNDERHLTFEQQKEIVECVDRHHWLSSSFLIFNAAEANRKLEKWKRLLPWIKPFYAMKSNPASYIIKTVSKNKGGIDCASKGEIK
jgi:diaminopimelate decarboxylase